MCVVFQNPCSLKGEGVEEPGQPMPTEHSQDTSCPVAGRNPSPKIPHDQATRRTDVRENPSIPEGSVGHSAEQTGSWKRPEPAVGRQMWAPGPSLMDSLLTWVFSLSSRPGQKPKCPWGLATEDEYLHIEHIGILFTCSRYMCICIWLNK